MKEAVLFTTAINSRATGSSVGIFAFQDGMFHGRIKPYPPMDGVCRLYRNTFFEAPIIAPCGELVLAARAEVFEQLRPLMEATVFETIDEFLFHMPYELGRNYLEIGKMAAWPEKFIEDKSILLHPVANGTGARYVAFNPVPVRLIPENSTITVETVLPFAEVDEPEEGKLVVDEALLSRLGVVGTWFGFQMSERFYAAISPHLITPWYLTVRIPLV